MYQLCFSGVSADHTQVVNATVSQSVPQMVSTAVKAVAKLFVGEILEAARSVQGEWIEAGEKQSELPTPPSLTHPGEDGKVDAGTPRGPLRPDHLREAWRRYKSTEPARELVCSSCGMRSKQAAWRGFPRGQGAGYSNEYGVVFCASIERSENLDSKTGLKIFRMVVLC